MIGMAFVIGFIGIQAAFIAVAGSRKAGSFRAWWRS